MESKDSSIIPEGKALGSLLLDVGISLMEAGASCGKIKTTMTRFAVGFHYTPHITIGSKSVSLTLDDSDGKMLFNAIRSTTIHNIDFNKISSISGLSWRSTEKELTVDQLQEELKKTRAPGNIPASWCFYL